MTLEEYEKKLLEKRKNLPGLQKNEGKRVIAHEEFESMQRIERKKDNIPSIKLVRDFIFFCWYINPFY